jgi:hypothetical protein
MNLAPGTIYSWEELCARFTANFASAYQQHGVEAHLHAMRQEPGETLRAFISRFTKVRGTIPRISDASIITAFRQGCVIKRCWRSWPRMTWKLSPHSSLWPTSALELQRAVHGTWRHRPGLPRRVAPMPSPRTARRRRRTAATRGRRLLLRSSQLRLGPDRAQQAPAAAGGATAAHALCTPTVAIAPRSAARLSSSQSASTCGVSSPPRTAPHPVAGLARRGLTTGTWPPENGTSGTSHPRGS